MFKRCYLPFENHFKHSSQHLDWSADLQDIFMICSAHWFYQNGVMQICTAVCKRQTLHMIRERIVWFLCSPTESWIISTGSARTPPSFPSLWSGGNRVLGSPKWSAIFTTLFNQRAGPLRPVAGSSPKAAEFNPRTAPPQMWWKTSGKLLDC